MSYNESHEHKAIFVGPPRTASRFTFTNLKQYGFVGGERNGEGMTHRYPPPGTYDDYLFIVTCRNPYQRMVSNYGIATNAWNMTFENFKEFVVHNTTKMVFGVPYSHDFKNRKVHWIRFEHHHEDFMKLPFVPETHTWTGWVENENSKNWKSFYTDPEVEQMVYDFYKEDFKYFGYPRLDYHGGPANPTGR